MVTVHAAPIADTFRTMQEPAVEGQVRRKAWRYLVAPAGPADPTWTERCRDYWELQSRTYGLLLSDFTMQIDGPNQLIVTHSKVLAILPGKRTSYFSARPN